MVGWIDIYGNIRVDCIDCGCYTNEGNRCYECWILAGKKMRWCNTDIPNVMIIPDFPITKYRESDA